jgi:cell division protein FtsB
MNNHYVKVLFDHEIASLPYVNKQLAILSPDEMLVEFEKERDELKAEIDTLRQEVKDALKKNDARFDAILVFLGSGAREAIEKKMADYS